MSGPVTSKKALRRALLAARRASSDAERAAEAEALAAAVPELVGGVGDPVCLYVPIGSEPGAGSERDESGVPVPALVTATRDLGRRVLLPVTVGDAPLDWAELSDIHPLVPARWGLSEPSGPRLGPGAVATAGLVLVPALAVDRRGVRLGRGGGHYDRTLPAVGPGTRLVALVRDDELLDDDLPEEGHDVRVHAVWRPRHGVTPVGDGRPA